MILKFFLMIEKEFGTINGVDDVDFVVFILFVLSILCKRVLVVVFVSLVGICLVFNDTWYLFCSVCYLTHFFVDCELTVTI